MECCVYVTNRRIRHMLTGKKVFGQLWLLLNILFCDKINIFIHIILRGGRCNAEQRQSSKKSDQ